MLDPFSKLSRLGDKTSSAEEIARITEKRLSRLPQKSLLRIICKSESTAYELIHTVAENAWRVAGYYALDDEYHLVLQF